MKKIIILSLFLTFVFSANLSMAESYSASCPTEAQAILNATGGCAGIDSATYSNIYENCCVKVASSGIMIVYVIIAVVVIALAIWQIVKRRKTKTIPNV